MVRKKNATAYRRQLDRDTRLAAARSAVARDIAEAWAGERPTKAQLLARDACRNDLRKYLETYHRRGVFYDEWSTDHLEVIAKVQEVVISGGLYAVAMPRGWGKTAILTRGILWAVLMGHRHYPILLAATDEDASKLLERHIKWELTQNDRLRKTFRAVTLPLRVLGGNAKRALGMLFRGQRVNPGWGSDRIILPTMPKDCWDGGPNVSGRAVEVSGLTASLRGRNLMLPEGRLVRPDCLLLDDPQTRQSAHSPSQCEQRLRIIQGDALGLAGERLAALAAVTIIRKDDLAAKMLNRDLMPEWQGFTTAAIHRWPVRMDLWDEWSRLRKEGLRSGRGIVPATAFYRGNRAEMDRGAVASWPKHKGDRLSALEWCFDKKATIGDEAWEAEFMNSPRVKADDALKILSAAEIAQKLNAHDRGIVPLWAQHLTAMIDCHDDVLFWVACAFRRDFTGAVVDYGTFPHLEGFVSKRRASRTLAHVFPNAGREGALRAGILALADELLGRGWTREDGVGMPIERLLVDRGYLPGVVADACRASKHAARAMPSRGLYVGPDRRRISEYPYRPGEQIGPEWIVKPMHQGGAQLAVTFDSNCWKTLVHGRLSVAMGDAGCLSLFGRDARVHSVFADHLVGEYPERKEAKGVKMDEWKRRPTSEVHWFDCLVGCHVAASMAGCAIPGMEAELPPEPEIVDMSQRRPWGAFTGAR